MKSQINGIRVIHLGSGIKPPEQLKQRKLIDEVKALLPPPKPEKEIGTIKVGSLVIKYYDNGKRVEYESTKNLGDTITY